MSNRDFSHTNLARKKAAQTQYAGAVVNAVALATRPGYIVKGGVGTASAGIETLVTGPSAAGATVASDPKSFPSANTQNSVATAVKAGGSSIYNDIAALAAENRGSL
jgi:hypothetical protein